MKELADLIVLLDDHRYAEYNIRFLIVGTPQLIKEYYSAIPNLQTVANRLEEIAEVSRLTVKQANELIRKGLEDELKYEIKNPYAVRKHIAWITDRIPEKLQEYCLQLSLQAEAADGVINKKLLRMTDQNWLKRSLYSNYTAIENLMNARETSVGRRNQVLYALGQYDGDEFRYTDIETIVRKTFPKTSKNKTLNVGQILSELSEKENPILKRTTKGDGYSLVNPKYRMALRTMLELNNGSVEKIDARRL